MKNKYNPVEKVLILSFKQCDPNKFNIKSIEKIIQRAVELSGSKIVASIHMPFDSGTEKPGLSLVHILSESHSGVHTSPEHHNYFSIHISTCGNKAHPFRAVGYLVREFNPSAGDIRYLKVGMDLGGSYHPKSLKSLVQRYHKQLNKGSYDFFCRELEPGNYRISFLDQSRVKKSRISKVFGINFEEYVQL